MASNWLGLDEALSKITATIVKADAAAKTVVTLGAAVVEAAAKNNFSGAHAKGQPHVGGNKPNIVSGDLRRSIHSTPTKSFGLGEYGSTVGPTMKYGRRVELGYTGSGGGRGHQTTRPFPYFKPAITSSRSKLDAISLTAWRTVPR